MNSDLGIVQVVLQGVETLAVGWNEVAIKWVRMSQKGDRFESSIWHS